MIKNIFTSIIKFIIGLIGIFVIIFLVVAISELIKDKFEKRTWLRNNTITVNGKVCIKKGGSYKNRYGLECCPGLKAIDEESKRDMDYYGSNKPCLISLHGGTWVCTTCGDGLCENKENECNCKEDCPYPEDTIE